ncbi:MAG: caspase family protein [Polyangiaceae bacterium]
MRHAASIAACLCFAALVVWTATAAASALGGNVRRYAVVIGNDRGGKDETPLRYAESDALKMATVLQQVGGFAAENVVLMRGGDAAAVLRGLIAVNDRIRTQSGGQDSVLLVFYSGHGDRSSLHLGDSRLDLTAIEQLVRGSSATVRLMILDACHSGALTRVKGGHAAPPMTITLNQRLSGEGIVFLTSSSASEEAQESDEIKSAFFTHYLTSGLLGAADQDQDGLVVLKEAYRHAYENTIRASSRTWAGVQHPTFRYELGGQGDIALSQLGLGPDSARVRLPPDIGFLVFQGSADGAVVMELGASDPARIVHLKPGRYFLRGRGADYLLEGSVEQAPGVQVDVDADRLVRTDYARMVRKGVAASARVHGPALGYQVRTPIVSGGSLCHGPLAAYVQELPELRWAARLGACRGEFSNPSLSANTDELSLAGRVAHAWDTRALTLDVGAGVGLALLRQSFETIATAPPRNSFASYLELGGSLIRYLPDRFYVSAELGAMAYALPRESSTNDEQLVVRFAARTSLQVGFQFGDGLEVD